MVLMVGFINFTWIPNIVKRLDQNKAKVFPILLKMSETVPAQKDIHEELGNNLFLAVMNSPHETMMKAYLSMHFRNVLYEGPNADILFFATMMVLKKCPNENYKEVYEFYANYFRQLKEPHINRVIKESLDNVDLINENELSQEFIQWTSNMDQRGFKIETDHANHAKYLFRDLLNNKEKIEEFARVCNNQKLRNHIGYLCVTKFNQMCDNQEFATDEEIVQIGKVSGAFYKLKFISNNSLRRMIIKIGDRATLEFYNVFVPLVKHSTDPYFQEIKKMILIAEQFNDTW